MEYDYIIIGAGPSGLTLAYVLGFINKKCLLIDSNNDIGGCHRVIRVNNLFSEHSPRVYSNSYLNFIQLLKHMNYNFTDLFTPYNFNISRISGETILKSLNFKEKIKLLFEFIKLIINPKHGINTSMKKFTKCNNFSPKAITYIDRLCRLTDGAGYDRYTLNQFLSLANQQYLYKLYQPKKPNDIGLFKIWKEAIINTNNVSIILNTKINSITENSVNINKQTYKSKNIILAIPPLSMIDILNNSEEPIKNAFGNFETLKKWAISTAYINDISIIFHWKEKLNIPSIYGFPNSEWGIAFIELSKYMNFENPNSNTVISTCITITNNKSSILNKNANECNKDEIITETFRQLKQAFIPFDLPNPDFTILNPMVIKKENEWINTDDTAYVHTYLNKTISSHSKTIPTLFNIGTHNGNSIYNFTSMESAVSNAMIFLHKIHPETQHKFPFKKINTMINIIHTILLIILIIIIIYIVVKIY